VERNKGIEANLGEGVEEGGDISLQIHQNSLWEVELPSFVHTPPQKSAHLVFITHLKMKYKT
jgi:hypothetical protein